MALQSFLAIVAGKFTRVQPLQASAGSGSAGSLIALNAAGQIDLTMAPDPAAFAASLWYAPYREVGTGAGSNPGTGRSVFIR